ncbi:MAG: hypothetical protein ACW98J_11615, partial [Candidatus Thorarchaeota archaeon]
IPPSPTPWGELAELIFTFDDVTGGGNVPIEDNPALTIGVSIMLHQPADYNTTTKEFTLTFNTSQFVALGQEFFTLDVTWNGAPFYTNRTGRVVFITILSRQTVLDYQAPAPTPYLDNVTFVVTWTDVTGAGSQGLSAATLTLYDEFEINPIDTSYYSVTLVGPGQYSVDLNTTFYPSPGVYRLGVYISIAEFYISDMSVTRDFNVRSRITLLSAEPTDKLPYNSTLQFVLNYQDLLTLATIGNGSGLVTFQILNTSTWLFSISWNEVLEQYDLSVETYNHPTLAIDTQYALEIQMTYASQSPFYGADTTFILFELRSRSSKLVLEDPADSTPYLDYANFTIFYRDL